jgi:hypothetical protein
MKQGVLPLKKKTTKEFTANIKLKGYYAMDIMLSFR